MYGRQTVAFGFSVIVVHGGWAVLALWWMNVFRYPFFNKAFTTLPSPLQSARNIDERVPALRMSQCVENHSLVSPGVVRCEVQVLVCVGRFPEHRGGDGSMPC